MTREQLLAKYILVDIRPWMRKNKTNVPPVTAKTLSGISDNVVAGIYTEGKGREIIQTILSAFQLLKDAT